MALNPERWDYSAAGVPSALTDDMAAHQEARDAEKKARHRAKEKVRSQPAGRPHCAVFMTWRLGKSSHNPTCECLRGGC